VRQVFLALPGPICYRACLGGALTSGGQLASLMHVVCLAPMPLVLGVVSAGALCPADRVDGWAGRILRR
jgi:hypothetical protein